MGLYLEKDSKGQSLGAKGKADKLIADGAVEQKHPHYVPNSVCVVDNGPFEAAAFAYNQQEFNVFLFDGTFRPKRWLEVTEAQLAANFTPEHVAAYRREVTR